MAEPITRDFYKTLICGPSGRGKTYSLKNMDRKTTGFINVENKPCPFKQRFEKEVRVVATQLGGQSHQQVLQALQSMSANSEIKAIVVDSFSAYCDLALGFCRATKKGFEIWAEYNAQIGLFMEYMKRCKKEVYVIAHDEPPSNESDHERRVKVKGNEWRGVVEKEFTIVVWADMKKDGAKKPEYFFSLYRADTSTKIPPDIFGEDVGVVPNDMAALDVAIKKFAEAA